MMKLLNNNNKKSLTLIKKQINVKLKCSPLVSSKNDLVIYFTYHKSQIIV